MKKNHIIIALVALVVAGVIAGGAFFFLKGQKSYSAEDVLPAEPIVYLKFDNIAERIERTTNTKLWNDLSRLDYKGAAAQLGVPAGSADEFEKNLKTAFSQENVAVLKMLFGQEAAVAVYPGQDVKMTVSTPAEAIKLFTELAGNVSFVTRVGPQVQAAESMSKFFGQFVKDLALKTVAYKGREIGLISSKDGSVTIGYVRFKDLIVFGFGEKAARSAVDVVSRSRRGLSQDPRFLERRKGGLENADSFGSVRLDSIYKLIKEQLEELAQKDKADLPPAYAQKLNEQYEQAQGIEDLVFSSVSGETVSARADIYFDPGRLHPDMKPFYTCGPEENRSEKFVPWDAIFYQWTTCLDLAALYGQYKRELNLQAEAAGQPQVFEQMIGAYETNLGLSIENDILPALGREFGIYLTDVETAGSFPVPKLAAFVQITSRDRISNIITKLLALQPGLKFEEEQYNGETIKFIPMPLADSFKLSYTFIDNYFLLAASVEVLKESLDAYKDLNKSLSINSSYHLTRSRAGTKLNSVLFVQADRAFGEADEVLDWSRRMIRQNAEQRRAFLAGSQKNLEDLKSKRAALEAEAQRLQTELSRTADAGLLDGLQQTIDANQKELAAARDREQQLSDMIRDYEAKAPPKPADEALIDSFFKPLLKALTNIKFLSTVTINREGRLESFSFWKLE